MKWRFVNTGTQSGAMNMALDESVMIHCARGDVSPTLRFYRWDRPTLTLGYFQKAHGEVNLEACEQQGVAVVRRLTGGRAVLHDRELTYSIVMGKERGDLPEGVTASYKILSEGLLLGFKNLSIQACMSRPTPSGCRSSSACFDALSAYELEVGGKKIVGSAQARRHGALLQHGSVLNDLSVDLLFSVLRDDGQGGLERARQDFLNKATSIRHETGAEKNWEELCDAFLRGFQEAFDAPLIETDLTPSEWELAHQLTEDKYSSLSWTTRR